MKRQNLLLIATIVLFLQLTNAIAEENFDTICQITEFHCFDTSAANARMKVKDLESSNCGWSIEKVLMDTDKMEILHLPLDYSNHSGMVVNNYIGGKAIIEEVTEGAHAGLLFSYDTEFWLSQAHIQYDKSGKKIIGFTSTHISYDGHSAVASGSCTTSRKYADWVG